MIGRDMNDRLIEKLAGDLRPVRAMRFGEGLAWLALAVIATLAISYFWLDIRKSLLSGIFPPMFLIAQGLFLMLGLATATTTVIMASPQVGNRYDGWKWALAMASLLPVVGTIAAISAYASNGLPYDNSHDGFCFLHGLAMGLLTAVPLILWLRRGAPASPARAGLLTGIAAGSIGTFAYGFFCGYDNIIHIGLAHSMIVIVSAMLGRLIVPRLIRW